LKTSTIENNTNGKLKVDCENEEHYKLKVENGKLKTKSKIKS